MCSTKQTLNLNFDMLIERRLAFASRGLLRGGPRRNFSVQVADLDASKGGIPSMPAGEEFLKARAAIREHAIREYSYIFPILPF